MNDLNTTLKKLSENRKKSRKVVPVNGNSKKHNSKKKRRDKPYG